MSAEKILVIRNDRIGDFVLALPSFALLKYHRPTSKIYALVPAYTAPIAENCPWIDGIIIDRSQKLTDLFRIAKAIKKEKFDAVISLFSSGRTGLMIGLSDIPYRLCPKAKLAQVFYNYRLLQKRSRSIKSEYAFNLDLIRHYLGLDKHALSWPQGPFIQFPADDIRHLKTTFINKHRLNPDHPLVFFHMGTGGSANSLNNTQWIELIQLINTNHPCNLILSVGPDNCQHIEKFRSQLQQQQISVTCYYSEDGLLNFMKHLACCDLFISPSTGPLHIAAALNKPTIGFFSPDRKAGTVRWELLNDINNRLNCIAPLCYPRKDELHMLDIQQVYKNKLAAFINRRVEAFS